MAGPPSNRGAFFCLYSLSLLMPWKNQDSA
jgi:hypothetical protein